jgi:hypothetical protein
VTGISILHLSRLRTQAVFAACKFYLKIQPASNLFPLSGAELDSAQQGGAGAVSN